MLVVVDWLSLSGQRSISRKEEGTGGQGYSAITVEAIYQMDWRGINKKLMLRFPQKERRDCELTPSRIPVISLHSKTEVSSCQPI